jgi:glutathione S-transferase
MIELYRFPGATCAAKVLMALSEKGAPFEDREIAREDLASEGYRKLNPNGVVPTLVHDGAVIIESSIILTYLDDVLDGPALQPQTPLGRARVAHWLRLSDDALMSLGLATYAIAARQRFLGLTPEARQAYYDTIPSPQTRAARRNAIELGLDAPEIPEAFSTLLQLQRRVDAAVQTQDHLVGAFGLADIAVAPLFSRMSSLGLLAPGSECPAFEHWWEKVQARASFAVGVTGSTPPPIAQALAAAAAAQADRIGAVKTLVLGAGTSG